LLFFSWY